LIYKLFIYSIGYPTHCTTQSSWFVPCRTGKITWIELLAVNATLGILFQLYLGDRFIYTFIQKMTFHTNLRGRHGPDRMVVGFTTTYAIVAYHH